MLSLRYLQASTKALKIFFMSSLSYIISGCQGLCGGAESGGTGYDIVFQIVYRDGNEGFLGNPPLSMCMGKGCLFVGTILFYFFSNLGASRTASARPQMPAVSFAAIMGTETSGAAAAR